MMPVGGAEFELFPRRAIFVGTHRGIECGFPTFISTTSLSARLSLVKGNIQNSMELVGDESWGLSFCFLTVFAVFLTFHFCRINPSLGHDYL